MDSSDLKLVKPGDRPSAEQWNLMVQLLKREVTGPNMFRDSTGWHFRRSVTTADVPLWYRLASLTGGGKYVARKQEWDSGAEPPAFVDTTDTGDTEYDTDVDVYDFRERDDATVGSPGTGQIVNGWKITVSGSEVTLVDVAEEIRITSADTAARHLRRTASELYTCSTKHHKIIGDSEEDADEATTGAWIENEIVNPAADEQLKIKHVGPQGGAPTSTAPHIPRDPLGGVLPCFHFKPAFDDTGHCIGWWYWDWTLGTPAQKWESPWDVAEPGA